MEENPHACPKCGYMREPGAIDCPACGIVYERYLAQKRLMEAPLPEPETAPAMTPGGTMAFAPASPTSPTSAVNPYAAPRSNVVATAPYPVGVRVQIWRNGPVLIMEKTASLPHRCVSCNAPADIRLTKTLAWHSSFVYLLILINLLIYLLVSLFVRKTAKIEIPLCKAHDDHRNRGIAIAWLISVSGLAVCGYSFTNFEELWGLFLIGLFLFCVGLIVGSIRGRAVIPKKIDDSYLWLTKVCPEFLATLPQAPPGF